MDSLAAGKLWGHTHARASLDQERQLANWYWDDRNSPVSCQTIPTPQVRRCLKSVIGFPEDKVQLSDVKVDLPSLKVQVPDYVEFHYLDFEAGTTRHHRDSLAAKGTVLKLHQIELDIQDGKDPLEWFYDQIDLLTTSMMGSNTDADVRIPYLMHRAGGGAMVALNEL